MNLIIFLTVLLVSFIVVRLGALAFQLTGLEWSQAKFQALSCFTATGFTTRESELVTATQQRRRIASVLIILGHAGFVTLIATFANSLRTQSIDIPLISDFISPSFIPWVNLGIIVIVLYFVYILITKTKIAPKLTKFLKRRLIKTDIIHPVTFEELGVATGGYGVAKIDIRKDSPILNKTLLDSQLRRHDITVLAIENTEKVIPNPPADIQIVLGDRLICFGKLDNIRQKICNTAN